MRGNDHRIFKRRAKIAWPLRSRDLLSFPRSPESFNEATTRPKLRT